MISVYVLVLSTGFVSRICRGARILKIKTSLVEKKFSLVEERG